MFAINFKANNLHGGTNLNFKLTPCSPARAWRVMSLDFFIIHHFSAGSADVLFGWGVSATWVQWRGRFGRGAAAAAYVWEARGATWNAGSLGLTDGSDGRGSERRRRSANI